MIPAAISLACLPASYWLLRELTAARVPAVSRRDLALLATCVWSALCVALIELLSLPRALAPHPLAAGWLISLLALVFAAGRLAVRRARASPKTPRAPWLTSRAHARLGPMSAASLGLIAFYAATTAAVALLYLPNCADAIRYHLPRAMHWAQDRGVQNFATNWFPEIQYGPFAEFLLLNFQLLLRGDQLANLVQWFAMAASAVGVSSLARKLGAPPPGQIAAALLCVSLPALILESTSNQNDLVVAWSLVCFVNFGLALIREPGRALWPLSAGLALGLGLLTKSTSLLFFTPFLAWFGVSLVRANPRAAARAGAILAGLTLLLNAGYLARNLQTYGSPIGPPRYFLNEDRSPSGLASVALRNLAIQAPIGDPGTLPEAVSASFLDWLRLLHGLTGRAANDARTTMTPESDAFAARQSYMDDVTGNPLHLLLVFAALLACCLPRATAASRAVSLCLFAGFLASSLLKWQVWGARLVLALFVVGCAPTARLLFSSRRSRWNLIPLVVALVSLSWLFKSERRPIDARALYLPSHRAEFYRASEYYGNTPDYLAFADRVIAAGCAQVGLRLGTGLYEYPIWRAFEERGFRGELEHVNPNPESGALLPASFHPCALIAETALPDEPGRVHAVDSLARYRAPGSKIFFIERW